MNPDTYRSMPHTLSICGIAHPFSIGDQPFACCTKPPGHTGDHECMVDYTWPAKNVIIGSSDPVEHAKIQEDPPAIMTSKIRAPKGDEQYPFIHLAIERALREGCSSPPPLPEPPAKGAE